ncbi:transporter [Luteimonas aquatica]|uniref:transporter n=1 Tax=Luteimonas aquatica TaxID=450364 RepID=UPI001F5ABAFD|nr:transporter [Luteimonas aquatica]
MTWSGDAAAPSHSARHASRILIVAFAALAATPAPASEEPPAFDRPGIAFATDTLPRGAFAWEQGLPDASTDRSGGVRTTTWTADTLLRLGLGDGIELQLGADAFGGVNVRGRGVRERAHGGGDGHVGMKWAPATASDAFSWAMLATASLPFGKAPLGGGGHDYDLGVTCSWALPAQASVSLYADRSWGDGGRGWMFSPSLSFPLGGEVGGYVEAGYGTGAARTRVAGGGVTWMATERLQLDASFLRGLDAQSPDWQGGIGMALLFP